jgi:predicted adenine nucleotide alpha hydrolase (AANH) superfamily ATPase
MNKKVLLHVCCGVCASWPVQKLRQDGYDVTGYFYNPNIQPEEEYTKRLDVAKKVSELLGFELIAGAYDPESWLSAVKGLENENECGKRCEKCFEFRLEATDNKAKELGIQFITSTLTVSPHKNARVIGEQGIRISGERFLNCDFKKQDGFKKTHDFAKQNGLYCQNYCGCVYSIRKSG